MKIIIIEDAVYNATEKVYKLIKEKEEQILNKEYYSSQQSEFSDFIQTIIPKIKFMGYVDFDFRL